MPNGPDNGGDHTFEFDATVEQRRGGGDGGRP